MIDLSQIRSWDFETPKFRAGDMAPEIVCASTAEYVGGQPVGELIDDAEEALDLLEDYLDAGYLIVFANAPYDLAVAAQRRQRLLEKIFRAIDGGKIHDIITLQSLDAIYHGHLGLMPNGQELRKPSTGEVTNRYSLEICTYLNLRRVDAKKNDVWRESYALLKGIPSRLWPPEAQQYPVDDSVNTIENARVQLLGCPSPHAWEVVPGIPGVVAESTRCKYCHEVLTFSAASPSCPKAPLVVHQNAENLSAQVEAGLALHLGAAWSLRTDPEKVEALAEEVEGKHRVAVARFQKKGWIRDDGTEDQAAVKRAIAAAYGATGTCKKCGGGAKCRKCDATGKVLVSPRAPEGICPHCNGVGTLVGKVAKIQVEECRGEKLRGRYQGCLGDACAVCGGKKTVDKYAGEITCKNVYDENEVLVEEGCDGTGFDLHTAPMLPRTEKLGVATDRDTAMESGDDDISDYGENEFEKSRNTYVPYLRTGTYAPLYVSSNTLVASGRCSYENCPVHQFPRAGGERKCIRARGRWCGFPIEMILGSTDYSAGELCSLGQFTYWLFGYSQMREAINKSGDPGILHSELAAEVLSLPLEEFLKRLKAKDKEAVLARQSSKPMNFGKPAAMGAAKIVLTNRKKSAGFTVCEGGPARNDKGEPGYWGIRFCITAGGAKQCGSDKILEWKNRPTAPVCRACCQVVESVLTPAYFRRFPEIRDYHKWGAKMVDKQVPFPSYVWSAEKNEPVCIRERGFCDLSAGLNNGFQSMLADIGKAAYVDVTRECYLGVSRDGSSSPLAGCRAPLFIHDEPLTELALDTAYKSGPRVAELMVASGEKLAPDVVWKADTAIAFWWDKNMEPKFNARGELIPWGPIPDYLQERFSDRVAA